MAHVFIYALMMFSNNLKMIKTGRKMQQLQIVRKNTLF